MLSWGILTDEGCPSLGLSHKSLQYQEYQYDPATPNMSYSKQKIPGNEVEFSLQLESTAGI